MSLSSLVSFREGCGATGPLTLEATAGDGRPVGSWSLEGPFAVIGRNARNDVVLPDEQVSGHHVYLQVVAGEVFWVDLQSRGGVIRGGIAEPCGWLPLDESLGIGPFTLRLTGGVPPTPAGQPGRPDARAWRLRDGGPAELVTLAPPVEDIPLEKWFSVTRMLTLVGRSDECRLRFADDRISRFQAALVRTSTEVWVVDLLSRTGLHVNESRTRWSALASEDTIDFGPFRLLAHFGGREGRTARQPALLSPSSVRRARQSLPAVQAVRSELVPDLMPAEGPAGPLVQQFGQLQQQMFDQFQQMMQTLLTTVGSLQSDQMAQIRKELDHVREITQELQSLQTATENVSPQPSPRRPAEAEAPVADHVPLWSDQTPEPHAHLRILFRIAELQNARQGIWQRVLNILKKPGVGETAP